jgi:hypothetical protein
MKKKKERRVYLPRVLGSGQVMMPADLKRLHKYMVEIEHISVISDEVRAVVEEEWPELAHKLPPKKPHGYSSAHSSRQYHCSLDACICAVSRACIKSSN